MSIIAHYKLNDNADTNVVVDDTGVHNGVYHGTGGADDYTSAHTAANSRGVGTCLDFDGTQDYISVADHADFTFGNGTTDSPFSISAWFYMDGTNFEILSKYATNQYEWSLRLKLGKLEFILYHITDTTKRIGRKHNTALSTGQWYHIVATYDGTSAESGVKIYIDAIRKDDATGSFGTYVAMTGGTQAVWNGRQGGTYANGLIDNVMIFDIELNADQVKALCNGGHGTEIVEVIDLDRRIKRR